MTTGPVSSQSQAAAQAAAQKNPAAAPPTPAAPATVILRSGEKQASTLEALRNPNSKVYYNRVAGAKFIMPNGLELQFLGGQLVTDDAEIIAELDKIANRATSLIFTSKEGVSSVVAAEDALAQSVSNTAGDGKE